MFNKLRQKKKFALIELIIVIVVIGIIAGITVPKFVGISKKINIPTLLRDIENSLNIMENIYNPFEDVLNFDEELEEYIYDIYLD